MILVIKMNTLAIWHQAKSQAAYAYDEKTLHILIRTQKNDFESVELIFGDPFMWDGDSKGKVFWKHEVKPMERRYQNSDFDYYFLAIKPPYFRTKYAFILKTKDETYFYGSKRLKKLEKNEEMYAQFDLSDYNNFPYLNHEDLHHTPSWVKDTVWYQIFPDRFYSFHKNSNLKWGKLPVHNNEFYGGDLKGITEKLDYLKDLGINGIYFTPIFKAHTAHKYDTEDYYLIDPQFGTNEDFKMLVDKAHEKGIKVMLDGVFNHCGYEHPFFQDVIKNGEESKYKDCFYIEKFPVVNFPLNSQNKPINYHRIKLNFLTFAFTPHMPKWNTSNPIVQEHLLGVIKYWIKNYDIDGWRLDVSNEISHDFLRQIKKVSREAKADTFILGENWDSSYPWLMGDQMDSVMNYDLSYPLWKYLEGKIDLVKFKDIVTDYLAQTPKNVMENMFNLVGSHDTIRIKRRFKDNPSFVKLAYLFMFLSAGAPNIYYGDEIGMTGEHDPDNRRCMLWDKNDWDKDFYLFTKKLIQLRKQYPSFKEPDYHFVDHEILVFTKSFNDETILTLMNVGPKKSVNTSSLKGTYLNLMTDETYIIRDTMDLETNGFMLLKKEA